MLEFRTAGFKGFATKYSPFFDSRIAVGTGQNYGLVGNGRLYILGLTEKGVVPEKVFDTQDVVHDIAWSEQHENQILAGCGDGTVKLYDINVPQPFPVEQWHAHGREVFSVHWNLVSKTTFLTSSWDGSVKIFDPHADQPITVLPTHSCTYSALFSPHENGIVSCVSADSTLRLFDLRTPASAQNHLVAQTGVHTSPYPVSAGIPAQHTPPNEVLTHDWNKYRSPVIATGGVDCIIRSFDVRKLPGGPIAVMPGHRYAIKKLSWSPHLSDVLLSASYDMTCRVWTDGSAMGYGQHKPSDPMFYGGGCQLGQMERHTEFATSVDWCMFGAEGWCASTGWDERVLIWDARALMNG